MVHLQMVIHFLTELLYLKLATKVCKIELENFSFINFDCPFLLAINGLRRCRISFLSFKFFFFGGGKWLWLSLKGIQSLVFHGSFMIFLISRKTYALNKLPKIALVFELVQTELMCLPGNVQLAKLLVEFGADVTMRNNKYRTILHEAAYRGHVDMTKLFIEAGVHVNAEDKDYRYQHYIRLRNLWDWKKISCQ